MTDIYTEVLIAAPVQRVWSVVADVARYSEWNPLIQSVEGQCAPGERLTMRVAAPGLVTRTLRVSVTEVAAQRQLRWLGSFAVRGLLDGDHTLALEPRDDDTTLVRHHESFGGLLVPIVASWLLPGLRAGFEAMNAALKLRAESDH